MRSMRGAAGFFLAAIVFVWPGVGLMQQQPATIPPGIAGQPGLEWTSDQIKQAVAGVRTGRKLTPRNWPNGAKVAVCLSYDVDNEGLSSGNVLPVSSSAGEYGALAGMPRILEMLDRHRIPASFYIPASSAINHPEMVPAIMKSGRHEIALHGWIHEGLARLDDATEEERLLKQSLDYFEKVTGKRPVGFRAPGWAWSRHSVGILRKSGLLYDSSMMGMDEPYEVTSNGEPTGLIELPVEWILDDAPYFGANSALPSPELIFKVYRDEFDVAYREGTMFMLTFHPHVIGRRSRMVHMERLVEYIKSKPGVWFATAEQIALYIKQNGKTE
jgi:peptidoglycan/xylan/chitin deacetylase (PgdA/CDA1 family)